MQRVTSRGGRMAGTHGSKPQSKPKDPQPSTTVQTARQIRPLHDSNDANSGAEQAQPSLAKGSATAPANTGRRMIRR